MEAWWRHRSMTGSCLSSDLCYRRTRFITLNIFWCSLHGRFIARSKMITWFVHRVHLRVFKLENVPLSFPRYAHRAVSFPTLRSRVGIREFTSGLSTKTNIFYASFTPLNLDRFVQTWLEYSLGVPEQRCRKEFPVVQGSVVIFPSQIAGHDHRLSPVKCCFPFHLPLHSSSCNFLKTSLPIVFQINSETASVALRGDQSEKFDAENCIQLGQQSPVILLICAVTTVIYDGCCTTFSYVFPYHMCVTVKWCFPSSNRQTQTYRIFDV
jgi:hypothetical protein